MGWAQPTQTKIHGTQKREKRVMWWLNVEILANRSMFCYCYCYWLCYFDWTLQHENAKHLIFNWIFAAVKKKTSEIENVTKAHIPYTGYPNTHAHTHIRTQLTEFVDNFQLSRWLNWSTFYFFISIFHKHTRYQYSYRKKWVLFRIFNKLQSLILYRSNDENDI